MVRRAGGGGAAPADEGMKERCLANLAAIATKPGPPALFSKANCPPTFCQPFADPAEAANDLADVKNCLLGGILVKLSEGSTLAEGTGSKVLDYWGLYLSGGTAPIDLSATRGKDFTESTTTKWITRYIVEEMTADMEANHAAGLPPAEYSRMPRVYAAQQAINTPGHDKEMDFDQPREVAGNLAGGVGKDQLANPIGAQHSPWDDLRVADVKANIKANPDGSVTITPHIFFVVQDTIDLCPGNCGQSDEQLATVPMSRFEATGLTGDVPFIVRFDAPAAEVAPFTVGGAGTP
jgi:hypothetical protein